MTYNDSFIDSSRTIVDIAVGASQATNYWLGGFILISFFIVFFIVFKNFEFKSIFLADSWATALLAGLLFFAGMIPAWVIGLAIVPLAIALLINVWGE